MSRIFFITILFLAALIRGPLSVLLIILKNVFPALRKRVDFERKNFFEDECRSFKKDGLIADYCFEVSSEGELEQVRPLVEHFLKEGKLIELLFSSPSVESKCLKLARDNPKTLRVLRMPLATHFFLFQTAHQWMSAPKMIFCRYDFFPELLILKFFRKKFILLSAAGKKPSWFKTEAFKFFDIIVAANKTEAQYFRENFGRVGDGRKIFDFDFRIPRIFERVGESEKTLSAVSELRSYLSFLEARSPESKLILGSAWVSDLVIFKSDEWKNALLSGRIHLLIVPHDLKAKSLEGMKQALADIFPEIPLYEISKNKNDFDQAKSGIVLLNLSGVLCELYTKFESAYVGGGFARSIHSVLEPYLSGARVFCGPKIHRSTEYDFIHELSPLEIHLLNSPESFYNLFTEFAAVSPDKSKRLEQRVNAISKMQAIIKEIEAC
ncbi:MAG: hypothetical protein ACXVLQ_16970 [Bacteriovorax sp.]